MSELAQKFVNIGKKDGFEAGREEGLARGRQEGRQEGLTRGRQEGEKKGEKKGLFQSIKTLIKSKTLELSQIAQIYQLPLSQIEELAREC